MGTEKELDEIINDFDDYTDGLNTCYGADYSGSFRWQS